MASYTPRLDLLTKNPVTDGADTFNIETMINDNLRKIDSKVATLGVDGKVPAEQLNIDTSSFASKAEVTEHKAEKATHIQAGERDNWNAKATPENIRVGVEQTMYSVTKSLPDAEGSFTTVEYKRKTDGKLVAKSVLSGGVAPLYTTRTITHYGVNGTTVEKTDVFALTYNADGVLIGEV